MVLDVSDHQTPDVTGAFLDSVGGVVPGYTGYRPGARQRQFKSTSGGVVDEHGRPRFSTTRGQGRRIESRNTTSFRELGRSWKPPEAVDDPSPNTLYLQASGGVKIGYRGFVPHARKHFGSSSIGGVDGTKQETLAQRAAAQQARSIPAGPATGTLLLPSMIEDANPPARLGTMPPFPPMGGAALSYGGHRPRAVEALEEGTVGSLSQYGGHLGNFTPFRRPHRSITTKVGATAATAEWVPPTDSGRFAALDLDGDGKVEGDELKAWHAKTIKCHNDWVEHQKEPPPSLPPSAAEYRKAVGGIAAGYSGFVPHSKDTFGESHTGMRRLQRGAVLQQRGHVGKTGGGMLLRGRAEPTITSQLAQAAVTGYAGHKPEARYNFGESPHRPNTAEARYFTHGAQEAYAA